LELSDLSSWKGRRRLAHICRPVEFFRHGCKLSFGTLLMPAFALFFPVPAAVAATAVVHLANNLLKTAHVGQKADWSVVATFAPPGAAAAMVGAMLLNLFAQLPPVASYALGGRTYGILPVRLAIGILIAFSALFDLLPRFKTLAFDRKYLPLGGLLSGFLLQKPAMTRTSAGSTWPVPGNM
jgi:hypothetical protein